MVVGGDVLHTALCMPAGTSSQTSLPVLEMTLYTWSLLLSLGFSIFSVPPPPSLSFVPEAHTRPLRLWRLVTTAQAEKNMSEGTGGRQGCGLRYMVVLKIGSAWRISELKTMPTSFSFPLTGMKQEAAALCPVHLHSCAHWTCVCSRYKALLRESKPSSKLTSSFSFHVSVTKTVAICYFGW